ncbi:DUF4062 domain-containing protein [Kocuria sp. NPDC057446]|uniref:DUF4062 domain-containing protein n=1 Tax=Kocuria sp. NPDC057446 TaxID=3346137 RepID=UPI00367EA36F
MNGAVILIASPGDAAEERAVLRDVLTDWNITDGRRQGVALLPWLWERHAIAQLGDRPQALINSQAVDQSDAVIAVFNSRLGASTGMDVSGTAEEINRAAAQGRPVHVYFSTAPFSRDADLEQITALRKFKEEMLTKGLLGEYENPQDLIGQVRRAIQYDIDENGWGEALPQPSKEEGARLTWRHDHRKEAAGVDSKGKAKYRTKANALVVRNEGETAAENLIVEVEGINGTVVKFQGSEEPVTLHRDSELQWSCVPLKSGSVQVTAQWTENGLAKKEVRTVSVTN